MPEVWKKLFSLAQKLKLKLVLDKSRRVATPFVAKIVQITIEGQRPGTETYRGAAPQRLIETVFYKRGRHSAAKTLVINSFYSELT